MPRNVRSGGIFVELYEITERRRKIDLLSARERVKLKLILQTGNQDGKTQGVEAQIQKHDIVVKWQYCFFCSAAICSISEVTVNRIDIEQLP